MIHEGRALGGRSAGSVGGKSPGRASALVAPKGSIKRRKGGGCGAAGHAVPDKRHSPECPRRAKSNRPSRRECTVAVTINAPSAASEKPAISALCAPIDLHPVPRSPRVAAILAQFGMEQISQKCLIRDTMPDLPASGIVLITGPSGSGKSSALAQLTKRYPAARRVEQIILQPQVALIDQVAPAGDLAQAARLLTACGIGEPRLWLRKPGEFSDGERFRAQLAVAVAQVETNNESAPLICDEFAANLHRRLARAIAFNLRKLATRRKLLLILATSQDDVTTDLQPDLVMHMNGVDRDADIRQSPHARGAALSFRRKLQIERGTKRDYEYFAAMHYRCSDELGFVDKVFVLREKRGGDLLGIIVYAHAPLELSLRNQATGGYFSGRPERVNAELRTIRRVVIHPDVRGCGLGHWLVRRTMPLVGTAFVETQTFLGEFNPIFQRAGMRCVGQLALSPRRRALLEELKKLDADPGDADFIARVCRDARLRKLAMKVVRRWYAATTGGGRDRVWHQSPELRARLFRGIIATRPVYYLWARKPRSDRATKPRRGEKCTTEAQKKRELRITNYELQITNYKRQESVEREGKSSAPRRTRRARSWSEECRIANDEMVR